MTTKMYVVVNDSEEIIQDYKFLHDLISKRLVYTSLEEAFNNIENDSQHVIESSILNGTKYYGFKIYYLYSVQKKIITKCEKKLK